ncbi:S26 family signal peptidase [Nonomuraea sp. JJY05]|jgi:signal peptidase I|uniref:S26 family signal peptidase n=1 Tax=Nonomuraea sp. JJY05 TaxID=3350255 RepID=UPI00373F287D
MVVNDRCLLVSLGALGAAAAVGVGWLRRNWAVITVVGPSMEPTYHHGDRVVVRRAARSTVSAGDVVVIERPSGDPVGRDQPTGIQKGRWMIKRVGAVAGDSVPDGIPVTDAIVPEGRLVLLGDNAEASFDSRQAGYFPVALVLGNVVRRMR